MISCLPHHHWWNWPEKTMSTLLLIPLPVINLEISPVMGVSSVYWTCFPQKSFMEDCYSQADPAFITPYIREWMTVKSLPCCASQMDKQENTIISLPNHHWRLYCLRGRGTICLHIVSGPIHSFKYLFTCSLPSGIVPGSRCGGGVW